jgi:hypothetical protein
MPAATPIFQPNNVGKLYPNMMLSEHPVFWCTTDIGFNLFLDNHNLDSPLEKLVRRTKVLMKL